MTNIEWTDETWNPVRGCSRITEGCRNCYAERVAARFSGYWARMDPPRRFAIMTRQGPRWTGLVELIPEKLREPLSWRKPRRVFVNSMSDLFHEALSFDDIAAVYSVMAAARWHTFQVLTKRPERRLEFHRVVLPSLLPTIAAAHGVLREWKPSEIVWPLLNVWEGVSCEDQRTADERIPLLLQTPAAVRFVSYEPALGPVDVEKFLQYEPFHDHYKMTLGTEEWRGLDWVIVGGESGPGARPCDVAWARSVVRQCREAGVACFVKQLGARPWDSRIMLDRGSRENKVVFGIADPKGGDPAEWPEDLRVREFPAQREEH